MKENYISYKSNLLGFKSFLTLILSFSYFALSAQCPGTIGTMTFGGFSSGSMSSIGIDINSFASTDSMVIDASLLGSGTTDLTAVNDTLNLNICYNGVNGQNIVFWNTINSGSPNINGIFNVVNVTGSGANLGGWIIRYNWPLAGQISAYYCGVSVALGALDGQELCVGSPFSFQAVKSPIATVVDSFVWTSTNSGGVFNPNNSAAASTTDFIPGTQSLADSVFVAMYTNQGCLVYDTIEVTVNPDILADINFALSDSAVMCENGMITIPANLAGGNNTLTYNWTVYLNNFGAFGSAFLDDENGTVLAPTTISTNFSIPNNITTIEEIDVVLEVTDATGCSSLDTMHITVIPEPDVAVTGAVTPVCSSVTEENVSLTLSNSNGFGDGFYWEVDYNGASGSGDGCTTGTSLLDTVVNTTNAPVVVEYVIWAYSELNGNDCGAGCLSTIADTIMITVNPYLEIADVAIVLCSDDTVNYNFPALDDNGTTIDSFSVSSVVGLGLTPATASSGTVIANLDLIADDVFNNISTSQDSVVYTVVPYYAGCAGDTFTITVTVNPEPVVADQTATVCSDSPIGVTLGDDLDGPSAATYNIVSVDLNGLTPSPELAFVGTDNSGSQNFTGRLGLTFTVNTTTTVNQLGAFDSDQDGLNSPIMVGIIRNSDQFVMAGPVTLSGTSDPLGSDGIHRMQNIAPVVLAPGIYTVVAVGYGPLEANGNTNIGDSPIGTNTGGSTLTFNPANSARYDVLTTFGFPSVLDFASTYYHAGTFNFVSSSTGNGLLANAIINDSYTNTTNDTVDVVYEVVPVSALGCEGDTFTVTVSILPEPVTDPALDSTTICSDEETGIVLNTNGTSVAAGDWDIISITPDAMLTAGGSNATPGDDQTANAIENDTWNNETTGSLDVVYVVVPVSADGCAGDTFTITVTVKPEPVVADSNFSVCSDEAIGYILPSVGDNGLAIDSFSVSASVTVTMYTVSGTLSGGAEVPPNGSPASGVINGVYNSSTNQLTLTVSYGGLTAPVSAAHIHGPAAPGVNAGVLLGIVPTLVMSGSTVGSLTGTVTLPGVAEAPLLAGLTYINIHNAAFPGGEIRAQLSTTPIGGDLSGTPTEGTGLTGAALAADVYNNVTNMPDTVWYTITPYTMGCAGDPYTLAVEVNPEPVVADTSFTVCSDEAIGYDLPTLGDNGLAIDSFTVTAVVDGDLTGSATMGTGILSGSALALDVYNNITNASQDVVYTVVPYTNDCAGDTFLITVTVNPEPVVADSSFSICSDVAIGYNLPDAGDNGLDIDSFGITAIVDLDLTGTPTVGTVTSLTAIAADVYNNTSNAPHMVVYTITPYTNGCAGDMYNLTVTVNPEPLGEDSTLTVCSDENFTYDPQGSIINQSPSMMIIDTIFYTGAMQTFTVPAGITSLNIKAFGGSGAAGSQPASGSGGLGGQAEGDLAVSPGQMLNVYVGGLASGQTGGFNGGGSGGSITGPNQNSAVGVGGGGGGASDVRFGGISLADRILVAGGGGGGGVAGCETSWMGGNGGEGGGGAGANGVNSPDGGGGFGGTVGTDGAAGIGCPPFSGTSGSAGNGGHGQGCCCYASGSSTIPAGGGGGGGYVQGGGGGGGSAGTPGCSGNNKGGGGGGAGGSSYTGGLTAGLATNNVNNGNGFVVISYTIPAMTSTFDWEITDIVGTVTGSIVGDSGTGIIQDSIHNVSNTPAVVTYSIVPTSVPEGCVGDTFTFIVTVNPEPVVADTAFTICSDDLVGYNLPDLDDDGGDIDSFDITAVVGGGLIGTASQGNGITDLTFIANDVFNNVTPAAIDVVYTVTPYFYGCAGEPYTITVTIDAEPVVNNQTATVCSDVALGITLNADNDGSPLILHYNIVNIDSTLLTSSAGNPAVADSLAASVIADDAWTNTSGGNLTVTYYVVPISVDGCEGDTFTVIITVRPEPVVSDITLETCSDVNFGTASQLPQVAGVSIGNYRFVTLNTNGLTSSAGADPADDTNAPGQYPFYVPTTFPNPNQISNANRNRINNDAWTNLTPIDVDVIYTLIPYSEDFGCPGDTFTVTATIDPEPVGVGPVTPIPVCSGVDFDVVLDSFIINDGVYGVVDDSLENVTYDWSVASISNGFSNISFLLWTTLFPGIDLNGSGETISDNIINSLAGVNITVNYTVTPTSKDGCEGTPFTVSVTIFPNPDVSLSQNGDNTLCVGESRTLQGSVTPNISPLSYDFEYSITAGTGTLVNANTISATVTATSGPLTIQFKATNPVTGCTDSISYTFTVNPLPTFTNVEDTIYACAIVPNGAQGIFYLPNGASAGSGTITFHVSESDADAGIGAIGNPLSYTGNDNQEIWVRLLSANGCDAVASFILSVIELPIVEITGTLSYCEGDSTILVATGGADYNWDDDNLTNNDTLIVYAPGTYTVTVSDDFGCASTASVTVTENPKPEAVIAASELAICYGESVTLTASGGDNFEWNTGDIVNQIIVTPDADSTFTVIVENAFGCLDTASITITVFPIPVSPDVDVSLDTCALTFGGTSAEFDLTLVSDSTLTFHTTESDAQNGLGSIVNPTSYTGSNGEVLWFSFIDINGCLIVGSFELVVNPLPTVTVSSTDSEICIGDEVTLTATGGGNYLWSNGETTSSIDVSPISTTTYTVTVTNPLTGCENSESITITVNPQPSAQIAASETEICFGESVVLTASGGDNYVWNTGDLVNQITTTPDDDSTYTVVVEDVNGCLDTASIDITVYPAAILPTVENSIDTCALTYGGTSAEFDLTLASDSSLNFYTTESDALNGLGVIVNPTSYTGTNGQVIWVAYTDGNGCLATGSFELIVNPLPTVDITSSDLEICVGEETTLTASGGGDYLWSPGGETTASIDVSPASTTVYTVEVTDANGCVNNSSVTVVVNALPTAVIAASETEICFGESVILTASGGDNFEWNTGDLVNQITVTPDDDSTFTVVVEDVNGCTDTASIDITVYPAATLPAVETSLDTCALTYGGTSAEFDLTLASDSSLIFHETESDALNGLGVIVNPTSYTGANGQLIWVSYVDTNGCLAIGSFELIVNPLPTVEITSSDLEICLGEETTLTASGGGTYSWTPGGATTASIDVSPVTTTVYTVEVTDANGCVNSSSVTVTVNPLPVAAITGTDGVECNGATITLEASGGDSYVWMNGVGNTPSVDVTITSDTTFTVVVTNAFGCTDTTDIYIELNPEILWDSTDVVNVTCNGGADGEVYALATGGTAPLTYAWEDGDGNAIGSSSTVTGLEAGSYHLTVTDDEGCSITLSLQVTEPDALQIVALISNNLSCNGDSTGNVSGTITGGDGSYEIFIEGSSSLDSIEDEGGFYFENLSADTYVITVVDESGCSVTTNVEITEPTPLLIAATPEDADCNGGLGTITISGSGGTPGYSYFVNFPVPNTPANSPSFDVPAGTYTVVIEDSHSCRDSLEVTVGEADEILTTTSYTEESCTGSSDGTATVVATSGTPGYTYLWTNGQTTSVATGLTAGEYFVTVYDANGCSVVDSVTVTTGVPGPPVVINCPPSDTFYVLDCDISYSWLAPTIVDNCVTTQLTLDLDGAENEGFALGIQQANFEPGVFDVTYTDETADPDTIACAFTITVFDTIVPVVVCPNTVQVQCVENIPLPYINYLDFIADGGILDDNCTVSLSTFTHVLDIGLAVPECTNRDTITRSYSVEDIYGNLGMCEQTIIVYDTIAPQVYAPADTIVNCDADKTAASTGTATADPDNCQQGVVLIWHSDASNQSGDLDSCDNYNYTITRTWYAQDECGNTDSVNQILTVQDTTKPVAVCQNFFVYLDGSGNASIVPDSINNASTDNCMPGNLLNLALDNDTFDCDDVPSTVVTLFVKDACGNTNSCTAIVTVADTVPPIAVCYAAITIYLDSLGNASIDSTFLDNGSTDNCAIRNMVVSDSEFDCDDVETSPNAVVLYVFDFYDNVDSCTTNVTVLDTINPIALCTDITVQLDSTGNVSITTGMINNGSNDACGIDTLTLDIYSFDCSELDDNTVVLTVTDVNGNSQTCSAVVTVEDNIFPVAVCNDITVELDSASGTYTLTVLDSAEIVLGTDDNCSFTTTFSDVFFTCFDVFAPVTVLVTYTDPSGNVSTCETDVTVNDVTAPTEVCNDITISLDSAGLYTLTNDDKDDIVDGTFDACSYTYVLDTLSFSCADVGSNGVLVTYTDPSDNVSTCTVQVTVTDTIAPVIVCQDTIINLDSLGEASLTAGELVVSALDACGIDTMVVTQTDYTCGDLGPNIETITVTDVNGNSKTCSVTVTVVDTLAPWFTLCKADTVMNTLPTSCFAPYTSIYLAPIIDNCTPTNALIVTSTVKFASGQDSTMIITPLIGGGYSLSVLPAFGGSLPVGLNTITVYAQDGSGNIDSCVWTVQVNDIWAPAVNNCPANITVNVNPTTCQAQAFWGGPNASDNCIGISLQTQNNNQWFSGAFFPGGVNNVTLVQYTATDGSGNTNTSCSFTVTVVGTCTPPAPDLSPEHITGGTNYNPGQTKNVVVRVRNLSANPTTAPVVFYVQKMNPNFTIGVNPSQTSTTVGINNYTVSNPDWDILEQPTRWRFTSKAGVVINGNTEKLVGISVTANNFPMSSANLSTNIVAGTGGGETPTNNNNKTNVLLVN